MTRLRHSPVSAHPVRPDLVRGWYAFGDSDSGLPHYKCGVLPTELKACMAPMAGFEPARSLLPVAFRERSLQPLEYIGVWRFRPDSNGRYRICSPAPSPLGYGTVWHRAEALNLFRPGQSRSCCRYTSPVRGARHRGKAAPAPGFNSGARSTGRPVCSACLAGAFGTGLWIRTTMAGFGDRYTAVV